MDKKISSGSPYEKRIGFCRARRIGSMIAVSGTAPIDDNGLTVGIEDVYAQTKKCIEISIKAIEDAGGSISGVIRTRIMLKDIAQWQKAAKAHGEYFGKIQPACTFVEISRFINEEWLVETEMDCTQEYS